MFVCGDCGAVFSTPMYKKRRSTPVCPECGSGHFREENQCRTCHNFFIGAKYEDYCPDCVYNAEDQLRRAVEKWVDADYIELLKDKYPDLEYILGVEDG